MYLTEVTGTSGQNNSGTPVKQQKEVVAKEGNRLKTPAIFTIGFTQKSAERFFSLLEEAGVQRVVDIRLHNASQLAGFAKQDDLRFFLKRISGIDYVHLPLLAPTQELLKGFQKKDILWPEYEKAFRQILEERAVTAILDPSLFEGACLLCSEPEPDQCHRRLVALHLKEAWKAFSIRHLI